MIKIVHKLLRIIWRITKPITVGARVIIFDNKKILLVKHTYQNQYFLPGGMIKPGETFEQAAKRELKEETGFVVEDLELFGVYNSFQEYKNDTIVVFQSTKYRVGKRKDSEIESFNFFDIDQLPDNISPGTKRRIEEFISKNTSPNFGIW